MDNDIIAQLRLAHFSPFVGSSLLVDFGEGPVPATVLEAGPNRDPGPRPGGGFSVLLRAPVSAPGQGVFRLFHPDFEPVELLMSPRRLDAGQAVYELILN